MSKKVKRRRLVVLLLAMLIGIGGLWALHGYRRHQARVRDVALRAGGLRAAQAGDYQRAVELLEQYLPRHADDVEPLVVYVRYRPLVPAPQNKHLSDTIIALRYLLRIQPQRCAERRQLLNLFIQTGYFAEALETSTVLLEEYHDRDRDTLRGKTLALARLRRVGEAERAAGEWVKAAPRDLEAVMIELNLMSAAKRTNQQIRQAAAQVFTEPADQARAHLVQGYALLLSHDASEETRAIEHLTAAANASGSEDRVFDEMLVKQLDAVGLANVSLDVVRRMDQRLGSTDVQCDLVRRCWEAGRAQELVEVVARATAQESHVPSEVLGMQALALVALGRHEEHMRVTAALQARGEDATAQAWALVAARWRGDVEASCARVVAACQQAIAQNRGDRYLRFFMGEAYASAGENELAVRVWSEAARQNASWIAPLLRQSGVLLEMGRNQPACEAAASAVLRARSSAAAQWALVRAWTRCIDAGRFGGTEAELLRKLAPFEADAAADAQVEEVRAAVLASAGEKDAAKEAIARVLAAPGSVDEAVLLRCADVSRRYDLGLEQKCFARCRGEHGTSAGLAFAEAMSDLARNRRDEALRAFDQARTQAGEGGAGLEWQINWARLLELAGDPRAAEALTAVADAHPQDMLLQKLALAAVSTRGDHAFRERAIQRLLGQSGEPSLGWRVAKANLLLDNTPAGSASPEALSLLDDAVAKAPDCAEARVLLGAALYRNGKTTQAIDQLRLARELNQNGAVDLVLAGLYREVQQLDNASEVLRKRMDSGGEADAQVIALAAQLFSEQGKENEATALLDRLAGMRLAPGTRELILAEHGARDGKIEDALSMLETAVAASPTNAMLWRALVRYELMRDNPIAAAAHLKKAVAAIPHNPSLEAIDAQKELLDAADDPSLLPLVVAFVADPLSNSGIAEAIQAAWQAPRGGASPRQVCEKLQAIADQQPRTAAILILLAQKHLELEETQSAIAAAARAAQVAPNEIQAYRLLVVATAQAGKWGECLEYARKWRTFSGSKPLEADLAMTKAYVALQRPREADALLQQYLKDPASQAYGAAAIVLAESAVKGGDLKRATALLEPLLIQGTAGRAAWMSFAVHKLPAEEAASWLLRVAQVIPNDAIFEKVALAQSWGELARIAGQARQAHTALTILKPLADAPDASDAVLLAMASQLDEDNKTAAAETYYRRLLIANGAPAALIARNNLAMLIARTGGNIAEAQQLIDDAIRSSPASAALYDTKAFVLSKSGDQPDAMNNIFRAIQLQPGNAEYRVHLAEMLLSAGESGKVKEALAEVEKMPLAMRTMGQSVRERFERVRAAVAEGAVSTASNGNGVAVSLEFK